MKCKNPSCEKDARLPKYYCSRLCAPYGMLNDEGHHTESEEMEKSTKTTAGKPYQQSSAPSTTGGTEEKTPPFGLNAINPAKNTAPKTEKKSGQKKDSNMTNTVRTSEINQKQGTAITPQVLDSSSSLGIIEKERLSTATLLENSTQLLFDLMKSNVQHPQIVCNAASELHKLIRLRLDIIRELGRQGES